MELFSTYHLVLESDGVFEIAAAAVYTPQSAEGVEDTYNLLGHAEKGLVASTSI